MGLNGARSSAKAQTVSNVLNQDPLIIPWENSERMLEKASRSIKES